jgi:tripartite-type tricarboxylate transporter receptor subunit TctC
MNIKRLTFAAIALLGSVSVAAAAEPYPSHPVRIIQPTSAGGPSDVLIRIIADEMSKRFDQRFFVENKPGAGGVIGTTTVTTAPPDGYTILSTANLLFTTAALRKKMPYDAVADLTGIGFLSSAQMVLVANRDFAPNTLAELVAYAKKLPEPLLYTSPNFGGVPFLAGQLLKKAAGIKLEHVTYSGSPAALIDVMAGRIPIMFDLWSSAKQHVESGAIKVIAVVTDSKLSEAPQYPLMKDTYPVFAIKSNNAVAVRTGTPAEIIKKLNEEFTSVVQMPEIQARMRALGLVPATSTPEEYQVWATTELARWKAVAEENGLSLE